MTQEDTHKSAPLPGLSPEGRLFPALYRLPSLTGLRFAAALLVFFNHVGLPFPNLRLLADDEAAMGLFAVTRNAGALGVTFFFVLSGFVLTWSHRPEDTVVKFWRRRFIKIYPNYVITWGLAMLLFAAAFTPTRTALANLFMLHVWAPDFSVINSVNQPGWSLACEAFFYASFPFLHMAFRRIHPDRLKYWIGGLTAAIMLTPYLAYTLLPDQPYFPGGGPATGAVASSEQYWFTYFFPPTRVLEFALGMLLAHAVLHGRWRNIGFGWSCLLLGGSYVLCSYVPFLYSQRAVTIIPIVLVIAAAALADINGRQTLFRSKAMVRLGELSFAFYLLHFVVLAYGRHVLGTAFFSVGQTILLDATMLAVTLICSWALYTLVEHPVTRRLSRSRKDSRRVG